MKRAISESSAAPPSEHAWELNPARNMLFISHANPEDNVFTQWLALRLAREGYPVWCDLTKLLGGETFWRDIEKAIRDRTAKLLFVLSRNSNVKDGALNELNLALGIERRDKLTDFVIPLRVDDLPYGDINIEIRRKNAIDFSQSWATGLAKLLEKLAQDSVPTDPRFTPSAVTQWWQGSHAGNELLVQSQDTHLSNWFPIEALPTAIFIHELSAHATWKGSAWELDQPAHRIGDYTVSFAPRSDFGDLFGRSHQILLNYALSSNGTDLPLTARQFRDSVVHLLRLGWDRAMIQRGLPRKSLARRRSASYFSRGLYETARVSFELPDGFSGSRGLVGHKTVWSAASQKQMRRYWHYGLSADARLFPMPVLILNGHIFFSNDGKTIWDSPKRLHTARRSLGGNWWNDDWRDRLLAAMSWIADAKPHIALPVASSQSILISTTPVPFEARISYRDGFARHAELNEVVFENIEPALEQDDETDNGGSTDA
ncbi:MAG: hypothetical protein AMXMBFR47_36530 [Planctomycetota bacterium]